MRSRTLDSGRKSRRSGIALCMLHVYCMLSEAFSQFTQHATSTRYPNTLCLVHIVWYAYCLPERVQYKHKQRLTTIYDRANNQPWLTGWKFHIFWIFSQSPELICARKIFTVNLIFFSTIYGKNFRQILLWPLAWFPCQLVAYLLFRVRRVFYWVVPT